jgi:hypothetical protein
MVIVRVSILYTCKNCGEHYATSFTPNTYSLSGFMQKVETIRQCTVCYGPMVIESGTFRTMDDKYGNNMFGSWQCPTHSAFVYYPTLIKKAVENTLAACHVGNPGLERYARLSIYGYPWKCPLCKKTLTYLDERVSSI